MSKENLKNKIHTSHFALHASNNGITLIALIITIIVMLILTGVTLSITLGDNGLVNKAKTASEEMQREMDKEELLSLVMEAYDAVTGEINSVTLVNKITEKGWTYDETTNLVKNSDGMSVGYLNTTTGIITDASSNSDVNFGENSGSDVEVEEVVSLDGIYYSSSLDEADFGIRDNIIYIDDKELPLTIDTKNKTASYTYQFKSSGDNYETINVIFEYEFIKENDKIINVMLFRRYIHDILNKECKDIAWQNLNGFTRGEVEGTYLRKDTGTTRFIFNPDEKKVSIEYSSDGVTWGPSWDDLFLHYDGVYYRAGTEMFFADDLNSFVYDRASWIFEKQN